MTNEPSPRWDLADDIQRAWARELPGAPVGSIGVVTRIWWLAKILGDERRRLLAGLGVDVATLDLLSTLRRSGPPYRLSPSELAAHCLVSRGAITQRVDRAARDGLVSQARSASGYHTLEVALTKKGHDLVERSAAEVFRHEQRLVGHLDAGSQRQLRDLLRDLLAGIASTAPDSTDGVATGRSLGSVGDEAVAEEASRTHIDGHPDR